MSDLSARWHEHLASKHPKKKDIVDLGTAMSFEIERLEAAAARLRAALKKITKYADQCGDPNGWLATNVRYAAAAADQQKTGDSK